ncbi:MAG: TetR/AcrR family transcriptional regulator [Bacteroidales bacterium]|jgi:AcrR family transcriptional regulator|nr:TetR/AcrR family transcriptional regulator [Bacteroidales bacterium]
MKKIDQILKVAKDLFWKFGINRVTIEEICRKSKVSKMTYYKYFNNKKDIVRHIYLDFCDLSMKKYKMIMASDIPFKEKVKKSLDLKREQTVNMSREFYNDLLRNNDPEIIEMVNKTKKENLELILNDYLKAQQDGDIRKDINPEFILYFLNHMFEMANDERLAHLYQNPNQLIMELTNFFFYGILPR